VTGTRADCNPAEQLNTTAAGRLRLLHVLHPPSRQITYSLAKFSVAQTIYGYNDIE